MTAYTIAYRPGTALAARYPEPATLRLATREAAEHLMRACVNAEHMEVREVEE